MESPKRPFVFLSTAMTLDGKISTVDKSPKAQICENDDFKMRWDDRIQADAIFIGAGQLRLDDPKLTVKTEERQKQRLALGKSKEPLKAVAVSDLSTIKNRQGDFFTTGEKRVLFTTSKTSSEELEFFRKSCEVFVYGREKVDLKKSLEKLSELGVKSVLVEGGGELIFSFLDEKLVDEIHLKIGNLIAGGRTTTTLVDGEGFKFGNERKAKIIEATFKENYIVLKCRMIY